MARCVEEIATGKQLTCELEEATLEPTTEEPTTTEELELTDLSIDELASDISSLVGEPETVNSNHDIAELERLITNLEEQVKSLQDVTTDNTINEICNKLARG